MDQQIIKQYLVSLGFQTQGAELRKFQDALKQAERMVSGMTGSMVKDVLKAGGAIISMYAAVGASTIALLERTSEAELGFKLFARRMYLNEDVAKRLKLSLDSLGVSQQEVVWGPPELARRFKQLMADQQGLQAGLGPGYAGDMEKLRDYFFEFNRGSVSIKYLLASIAHDIERSLGPELQEFFGGLRSGTDYLIRNLPEITAKIDKYLVPVLHDTYAIFKDIYKISEDFLSLWSLSGKPMDGLVTIMGIISGVSHEVRNLVDELAKELHVIASLARSLEQLAFLNPSGALDSLKEAGRTAMSLRPWEFQDREDRDYQPAPANDPAALAAMVSKVTGIPGAWLYGQMAFETDNFRSRLFREQHNVAGLTIPGTTAFRNFGSFEESAAEMARILNMPRYSAARQAKDLPGYVAALGAGGYYGKDSPSKYLAGVGRYAPMYYTDAASTTINVHVAQPNASAEEIARQTWEKFKQHDEKKTQRNLLQLQGAYK